jgi:hypothetical protein
MRIHKSSRNGFTDILELDKEIIMNICDIDSLINLYQTCHDFAYVLEDKDVLNKLLKYHNLNFVKKEGKIHYRFCLDTTFSNVIREYDCKYVNVRSLKYLSPMYCTLMASEQNNEEMFHYYFERALIKIDMMSELFKSFHLNKMVTSSIKIENILIFENVLNIIEPMTQICWWKIFMESILTEKETMYNYVRQRIIQNLPNMQFDVQFKSCCKSISKIYNEQFFDYVLQDIASNNYFRNYNLNYLNAKHAAVLAHWNVMHKIIQMTNKNPSELLVSILKSPQPEYIHQFIQLYNPTLRKIGRVIKKSISLTGTKISSELLFEYGHLLTNQDFTLLYGAAYKCGCRNIIDMLNDMLDIREPTFSVININYNFVLKRLLRYRLRNRFTVLEVSNIIAEIPDNYDLNYESMAISSSLARDYEILANLIYIIPQECDLDLEKLIELILNTTDGSVIYPVGVMCNADGTIYGGSIKNKVFITDKDVSGVHGCYYRERGAIYAPEEIIPDDAEDVAISIITQLLDLTGYEPNYNHLLSSISMYKYESATPLIAIFTVIPNDCEIHYSQLIKYALDRYMYGPNYFFISCLLMFSRYQKNVDYQSLIELALEIENFILLNLIEKYSPYGTIHYDKLNYYEEEYQKLQNWKGNKRSRKPRNRKNFRAKRTTVLHTNTTNL